MNRAVGLFGTFLLGLSLLAGCGSSNNYESNSFEQTTPSGTLAPFSLVSPTDGLVLDDIPTFKWGSANEEAYYMLEIASTSDFNTSDENEVYYRHDYIYSTEFDIGANLAKLDTYYYWKVTAKIGGKSVISNNVFSFYLSAPDYDEVDFNIGDAADWSIHTEGIPVDLSIDKNDFFGNGKDSMAFTFEKEKAIAIGWVVVTRTIELDTYGTDSLFMNFFYSGDDATAFVRVVDNAGGFWRHKISLANNSKQTIILPFDEFTHDTESVNFGNSEFQHYHIKYFEVVLEKSWGDGACLVSNIKTVKRSNYDFMFFKDMDFSSYDTDTWLWENDYNFGTDISEDGKTYTLSYSSTANELNDHGISGYGFAKIPLNKFFDEGDMAKMDVKYSGNSSGSMSFRVKEEDGDLWYYMQSYSGLSADEYTTLYIPFESFACSYYGGNGKREFSYVTYLQFGLTNMYGNGTLTYSNVEIVAKSEQEDIYSGPRQVGADGLIENFDTYTQTAQPFYQWNLSISNKDEFIALDSTRKIGSENAYCGKFTYKSDMEAAYYTLPVEDIPTSSDSISLWMKDVSIKSDQASFNYLDEVKANAAIGVTLTDGNSFYYLIEGVSKLWTKYTIPFVSMSGTLAGSSSNLITPESISSVTIALSYFYYDQDGTPDPVYTMLNPVYIDNMYFLETGLNEPTTSEKEKAITIDSDQKNATFDDFESYSDDDGIRSIWNYANVHEANNITLSNDVSADGGNHSAKMDYQGYSSVSYSMPTTIEQDVGTTLKPKGMTIDIKGDGMVTIYLNIYYMVGSTVCQVRKTISDVQASWNRYQIGFDKFTDYTSPSGVSITVNNIKNVYKVTLGAVDNDGTSISSFCIDNFRLSNEFSRSTYSVNAIS